MNIYPTIEALLSYAEIHLLFDELDSVYARNRIMELLGLSEYEQYEIDESEIEAMQTPDQLVDALVSYAVAEKVIDPTKKDDLARRIMSVVLKRPSEIADIFDSLPTARAFEWLYDYSFKAGSIIQPKKWEAKASRGKIEAAFTGCDCKGSCCTKNSYPACGACRENEGLSGCLNSRFVPIELAGERMFFTPKRRPLVALEGRIVSEYHSPLEMGEKALNKMFDFCTMLPNWFIAAKDSSHEKYSVGSRLAPLSKAPDKTRFKSATHPYIAVSVVDWYFGVVRLVCTNREKLIEYACSLISAWGEDKTHQTAAVVRKTDAGFVLELLFLNKDLGLSAEYTNLTQCWSVIQLLGVFGIGATKENQLRQMEKFVTKQEKISAIKDSELAENEAMLARIMQSVGNQKPSQAEAVLEVKDEINRTLENALISLNQPIDSLFSKF